MPLLEKGWRKEKVTTDSFSFPLNICAERFETFQYSKENGVSGNENCLWPLAPTATSTGLQSWKTFMDFSEEKGASLWIFIWYSKYWKRKIIQIKEYDMFKIVILNNVLCYIFSGKTADFSLRGHLKCLSCLYFIRSKIDLNLYFDFVYSEFENVQVLENVKMQQRCYSWGV